MRPPFAALLLVLPLSLVSPAGAQDVAITAEDAGAGPAMDAAAGCGCRNVQRPPWHGSVQGQACGPACGTGCGGVFHANPCGQLHLRRYAREHCMTLPPCFPRLHALCAEGFMPTPPPPALPRCHQCGAVIEGGF
ncbi:MAG: hypothetical protein EBS56_12090 [Planctomycetia bacterium]|nr:hypothetical protein [Planctomycetia bacterium]